jgi:restriction system protein
MAKSKGPEFIKFFQPIIEVLKNLDGSGKASEVTDIVIETMKIPEKDLDVVLKSGISRIKNQIHWARMYLVNAGIIDSSKRGVWSLTEKGLKTNLSEHQQVYDLFKKVHKKFLTKDSNLKEKKADIDQKVAEDLPAVDTEGYKDKLLKILRELPAPGFERICQRLLREAGFKKVTVTGKSGDGGIDGEGILEVNPLMSFKVLFQSKRYKDGSSVRASHVRDFRGAMQGRADKGIIITTGRFTQDAKKEALRDGAPPIELVDGDGLIELFEQNEFGLKPLKTYEIVDEFFNEFRK